MGLLKVMMKSSVLIFAKNFYILTHFTSTYSLVLDKWNLKSAKWFNKCSMLLKLLNQSIPVVEPNPIYLWSELIKVGLELTKESLNQS